MSFSTSVWVVNRVHGRSENRRSYTHPALTSGLTDNDLGVVYVRNRSDRCVALLVDFADFSGRHLDLRVLSFLGKNHGRRSSGSYACGTLSNDEFNVVYCETYWNVGNEHAVTSDWLSQFGSDDRVPYLHVLVSKNVTALSVFVANEGNVSGSEWIVFDRFNTSWNVELVRELEVYLSVKLLMSSALVAYRDTSRAVTTSSLELEARKWLVWFVRRDLLEGVSRHLTAPWSRGIILLNWHRKKKWMLFLDNILEVCDSGVSLERNECLRVLFALDLDTAASVYAEFCASADHVNLLNLDSVKRFNGVSNVYLRSSVVNVESVYSSESETLGFFGDDRFLDNRMN